MAAVPTLVTNEDLKIAQNRGEMGVLLLRKKEGSQGLSSGSIVNVVKSKHFLKSKVELKWCILTCNVFPPGDIRMDDYFIECANSETHELSDIAQSANCYRPPGGLVLIPVHPTTSSNMLSNLSWKSSVFDDRRTFSTEYYESKGSECRSDKSCFIVGSHGTSKDSWTVERFALITKKDQGRLQYELHAVDGTISRTYDDIMVRSHLYPRGAVILKGEGRQATCIGVLNFLDKKISPVFFTTASLTAKMQLYYPTSVKEQVAAGAVGCTEARTEVDANLATGHENHDHHEGSPDDDHTVFPDDHTLQKWQELYAEKTDECTRLKQQSELDHQEMYQLRNHNVDLRIDVKNIGQENEVLRIEMEELCTEMDALCAANEALTNENLQLRKDWQTNRRKLCALNKELREGWDTEFKESEELRKEFHAKTKEWHAKSKEWRAEIEDLRVKNEGLRAENEELLAQLKEVPDQLKELLCPKESAVAQFEEDTSSGESTKDVKAEGPSGSSANNKQADSDGSCKEEPFLDPLSKVASKLD